MNAREREQLRGELLELHFDCHPDPEGLRARLAQEPELRALQQQVLATAELLEQAALAPAGEVRVPVARPRSVRLRWAALLIGSLLIGAPLAYWGVQALKLSRSQHANVRLLVTGPAEIPAGAPARFHAETWNLAGDRAETALTWRVLGEPADSVLASGSADATSAYDIEVPPLLGAHQLEVTARPASGLVQTTQLALRTAHAAPLAHLSTDRPIYRQGDDVFLRAVLLDRLTMLPSGQHNFRFRVTDPRGAVAWDYFGRAVDGVTSARWKIPADAPGGQYEFELRDRENTFAYQSLGFTVRRYQPPVLRKTVELAKETYAPGAHGSVEIRAARIADGATLAGADVRASLVVDGAEVWQHATELDRDGRAVLGFDVPRQVERGDARVVARISDGSVVETAVATFVIPTGQVEVTLLPEGGELVAGFDNRVYAEVVDPLGRPVTARGDIVDSDGRVVTEFATAHQGRGRFSLTPRAGERYRLQLHDPVATTVALPDVHRDGVVLRTIDDATDAGARLRFRLATSAPGPWLVGVFLRGTLVGETTVTGSGVQDASIALAASSAGVLRVTVFDSELQPVAERLVHRHSGRRIDIDVEIAHPTLTPGERQTVRLTTRDETGQAVAAMLGVAVTDQAVRDMAGERRIGIADRAWLVADVDEIENVEEFVGGTAAADQHVDLLLGTRGWRRLLWRERDLESMVATHGERARCFVVSEGYGQVPAIGEAGPDISALVAQAERARTAASWALGSVFGVLGLLVVFVSWRRFARWAKLSPTQFWTIHASVAAAGVALLLWLDLGHGTRPFFYEMFGHAERAAAFAAAPAGGELAVDAADMAYIRDFDVQVAQGAVVNLPRAGGPGNVDNFFFGRGGNDRLEAKLGRLRAGEPGANAGVCRVYYHADDSVFAHSHAGTGRREDFAETVYWSGALRTDMAGQASFDFDVSDRVTTWSIDIDAHGAARVGQLTAAFQTALPLHLEPVLPLEVSQGDRLRIPVAVLSNAPATEPVTVAARVTGSLMLSGPDRQAVVLRDGRGRAVIDVDVGEPSPDAAIEIAARSGRHQDSVHHPVRVVPRGFPHREGQSGVVDDTVVLELALPDQHVPGSMDSTLTFYPSPLATLGNGMTGMLREPCGCFEQASSSNYPNVMLLTFLEATGSDAPAMARRARGHLQRGYGLIAGYECSSRGFEWFGDNPGHEALSAYGLLQFTDMAKVYAVDDQLIARTRRWLLARRDGTGGYVRNERALDSFGRAPQTTTDAYITYALVATGTPAAELTAELDRLEQRAVDTQDSYELAVAACALAAGDRPASAKAARARLLAAQAADGSISGGSASITRSGTRDLLVETTSFAVLAWLGEDEFRPQTERAVRFLLSQRTGSGTFGATQATVMALKALTAHATGNPNDVLPGEIRVRINGKLVLQRSFPAGQGQPLTYRDLHQHLRPGRNELEIELTGGNEFPWSFDLGYFAEQPANDARCQVEIETNLGRTRIEEGEVVPLTVRLRNRSAEGLPMTMAIVGLPAGLHVPTTVLDDLRDAGRFDLWEIDGRDVVLYWRAMAPKQSREVVLDCVARVPGLTRGPASRAFLYYTPRARHWAAPLAVEVTPLR